MQDPLAPFHALLMSMQGAGKAIDAGDTVKAQERLTEAKFAALNLPDNETQIRVGATADALLRAIHQQDRRAIRDRRDEWALALDRVTAVVRMVANGNTPPVAAAWQPAPDSNHAAALQVLVEANATDRQSAITTDDIARKVSPALTANEFKAVVAKLSAEGYVETQSGRRGGVWLTDKGAKFCADMVRTV